MNEQSKAEFALDQPHTTRPQETFQRLYDWLGVLLAVVLLLVLGLYFFAWHDMPNLARLLGLRV